MRLGAFEPASPDLRRIQDISRDLEQRRKLETMRQRFRSSCWAISEARKAHERAASRLKLSSAGLDRTLAKAYRDPAAARARIEGSINEKGVAWTTKVLERNPAGAGALRGRVASKARGQAREAVRRDVTHSIREHASAVQAERSALERLEPFRRNPKQPVLEAAGRAWGVLGRGLRRLDEIERRYEPQKQLQAQAARVVERIGWKAVEKMLPITAYQAIRMAVSLVRSVERVVDRGLER